MPTYEYRCNGCQREFEYQQKMSDPDLVTCEACGEDRLEKLISWTSFQLKGSGWYKDLYSSNPKEAVKDGVDKGRPPKTDAKPGADAAPSGGGSSGGDSGASGSGSGGGSGGTGGTSGSSGSTGSSGSSQGAAASSAS